jgi:peptidoglycan hydrolase-like protein with peptidoglycan-binding domain
LLALLVGLSAAVWVNMLLLQGSGTARMQRGGVLAVAQPGAPSVPRAVAPVTVDAAELAQRMETTRAIQRELQARGYGAGDGDGVVGVVTRATIMAYEFDRGLPLTAEPSDDLLVSIVLGTATLDGAAATGSRRTMGPRAREVVGGIKQALVAAGYGPVTGDDVMGDDAARAIRRFERDHGLVETGRISGALAARLARATLTLTRKK